MAKDVASIRNIATSGHGGSGKTTLVEAMLNKAGATKRIGSVDEGTSIADFDVARICRLSTLPAIPILLPG